MANWDVLREITKDCRAVNLWAEIQTHDLQNIDAMY
jgi:hypothetical protein